MKWLTWMILVLLAFSSVSAVTESDIPSLTNYHQFYGQISGLPAGSFMLRLQVGTGPIVPVIVATDGRYGFSEVLKVSGIAGNQVTFTLVSVATGAPTRLGEEPYVAGKVQEKDWQFSGANSVIGGTPPTGTPPTGGTPPGGSPSETDDRDDTSTRRPRTRERDATVNRLVPSACLESWECGSFSECNNKLQTRTCLRVDTCDAQLARGEVGSITRIPKPAEQQSCVGTAGVVICQQNSKRCLGNNLQQCSADGTSWVTINSCPQGCDPVTLACRSAAPAPVVAKPAIPWLPIGAGIAGLLVVVAVILIVMHLKRSSGSLQPVREYIMEARKRGFSNEVIKTKLMAQGWDAEKIEKILK